MRCPQCSSNNSRVLESRSTEGGTVIRRRRECNVCCSRFTTYERLEELPNAMVKKANGQLEDYDIQKIKEGINKAIDKLPIPYEPITELINRIDTAVRTKGMMTSKEIGNLVMEGLRKIDPVAYIRFAAVYRRYTNLSELEQVINDLKKDND